MYIDLACILREFGLHFHRLWIHFRMSKEEPMDSVEDLFIWDLSKPEEAETPWIFAPGPVETYNQGNKNFIGFPCSLTFSVVNMFIVV